MPPDETPSGKLPAPRKPRVTRGPRHGEATESVYGGALMRSRLEVTFAQELDRRGIAWQYEPERVGGGRYLVDFHLPDLKCWVEVKGRFEAPLDLDPTLEIGQVEVHQVAPAADALRLVLPGDTAPVKLLGEGHFQPRAHERAAVDALGRLAMPGASRHARFTRGGQLAGWSLVGGHGALQRNSDQFSVISAQMAGKARRRAGIVQWSK